MLRRGQWNRMDRDHNRMVNGATLKLEDDTKPAKLVKPLKGNIREQMASKGQVWADK